MEVTQAIRRAQQQRPNDLLTVDGQRHRTVAESIERVARLAGALRNEGIEAGDRVAILAANSDRYHEALLGVVWAGGAVVPVNTRWSPPEITYSLAEVGARSVIVDDTFIGLVPELRRECPDIASALAWCSGTASLGDDVLDYEAALTSASPIADAGRGGDDIFGVFYTGGTTGAPKGVTLTHDNVLVAALGSLATGHFLAQGGRLLHVAPMFHLADIACWVAGNLVGSTHIFLPAFEPDAVLKTLSTARITDVLLVPTMIQMLADHPSVSSQDLSGVRHIVYGASPIADAVLERAQTAFPSAGFVQAYGMTELGPTATVLLPEDHDHPVRRRSAGRAAPHAEVRVVDLDDNETPRGTVGEVIVRGDNLMVGYWNQDEETRRAVRDGWMHTGDAGYMDEDGFVYIVDRIKDMIITGGENVYSAEVENAIAQHVVVAACAVVGVPDQDWGERVHAFVVPVRGQSVEINELRIFCRPLIANYKLPRSLTIIDALPTSSAGKVLKTELRRLVCD